MNKGYDDLEWMLEKELNAAERYRRYVSVALFSSKDPIPEPQSLKSNFRDSDIYFDLGDQGGAILMTETNSQSALVAVERLRAACQDQVDLRFAIGTYPFDRLSAPDFLKTTSQRLREAEARSPWTVVRAD